MSPMPHILAGLAYVLGAGALALAVSPLWGLAAFAGALAAHAVWWNFVLVKRLDATDSRLGEMRRELKVAREDAKGILEAIEGMASKNADMRTIVAEMRVLKGLVEELSGKPIAPPDAPAYQAPAKPNLADSQVLDIVRDALREGRVELYLQPIVDLPQRRRRHYECFSRMRAPDGTLIGPDSYLALAEAYGLVTAIDNMLLFRGVQLVRRIQGQTGGGGAGTGIFVNISQHTLADRRFFGEFVAFMAQNVDLAPNLVFELAEAQTRKLKPEQWDALATLAKSGFRFSMDQVIEPSHLDPTELAKRNFRFVKIEARKMIDYAATGGGAGFVRLRQGLADSRVELVIEKIENEPMLVEVLDLDAGYGQGYLFGEPKPLKESQ
jgi:cyclic-di-GMP phosphodiesterase TipF (flagellum assembly factor)